MKLRSDTQSGFTLVIVLIMSTALIVLAGAMLQTVSTTRIDNTSRYYSKLAEEAAEAGAEYAKSCLELYGRQQTWGNTSTNGLAPNRDCSGTAITSNPVPSSYVFTDSTVQSSFDVRNLETTQLNSAIISSTGKVEVKNSATGVVVKTYTHIVKKTIVWTPDLEAQKSASGRTRTCAVLSSDAYCWGTNQYGQLGNGTDGGGSSTVNSSLVPVKVKRTSYGSTGIGSHKITDMIAGDYTNCALIDTGEVYCWGLNTSAQLGIGSLSPTFSSTPLRVTGLSAYTIVDIGVGGDAFCALTSTGALLCWGSNARGQVGNNSSTDRSTPILIGGPTGGYGALANKTVTGVSTSGAFNAHICAIAGGLAYCWGRNLDGQLGNNPSGSSGWADQKTPVAVYTGGVLSGKTVTSIAGDGTDGDGHTCAMAYTTTASDAKAYCWGSHADGFLGNNTAYGTTSKVPTAVYTTGVLASKTVVEIAVNAGGGCAVAYPTASTIASSQAYCWGLGSVRGDGTSSRTNVPVQVADTGANAVFPTNQVYGITGGAFRFCALVLNKSYCWGVNGNGQIGDGTTVTPRLRPTESLFLRPDNNEYIF